MLNRCPHAALGHTSCCVCACAVGDDHFIIPRNLERVLTGLDPSVVWGPMGCSVAPLRPPCWRDPPRNRTQRGPVGLCGGGGIALSRETVKSMVGDDPHRFLHEYLRSCHGQHHSDQVLSCELRHRGIVQRTPPGGHKQFVGSYFNPPNLPSKEYQVAKWIKQVKARRIANLHYFHTNRSKEDWRAFYRDLRLPSATSPLPEWW